MVRTKLIGDDSYDWNTLIFRAGDFVKETVSELVAEAKQTAVAPLIACAWWLLFSRQYKGFAYFLPGALADFSSRGDSDRRVDVTRDDATLLRTARSRRTPFVVRNVTRGALTRHSAIPWTCGALLVIEYEPDLLVRPVSTTVQAPSTRSWRRTGRFRARVGTFPLTTVGWPGRA